MSRHGRHHRDPAPPAEHLRPQDEGEGLTGRGPASAEDRDTLKEVARVFEGRQTALTVAAVCLAVAGSIMLVPPLRRGARMLRARGIDRMKRFDAQRVLTEVIHAASDELKKADPVSALAAAARAVADVGVRAAKEQFGNVTGSTGRPTREEPGSDAPSAP